MDLEGKKNSPLGETIDKNDQNYKESKVQYTRDFLLSLSERDACKNFPSDFDQSILSEFNDSCYYHVQDRKKLSSNLSSQGFRHNEHCAPPPSRVDSHNHSRGVYGRWESRSTGRSDKDRDSQSDRDSDSGWLHANKSNGTLKNLEHDGLLGSGSFEKQQIYSGRSSFQKVRSNEAYIIKRNSDISLTPRTYKALPYPRREGNDFYNNETFGSLDCKSEDNVQEEQRRRASFELMREEQKALVEKSKSDEIKDVGYSVPSVRVGDPMVLSQETRPLVLPCSNGVAEQNNLEVKFSLENFLKEGLVNPKHHVTENPVGAPSTLSRSSVIDAGSQLAQILDVTTHKFEDKVKCPVENELVEAGNEIKGMINYSSLTDDVIKADATSLCTDCKKSDENRVHVEKIVSPRQQQSTSILEKIFCTASMKDDFSSGFGKGEVVNSHGLDMVQQASKFSPFFTEGIKPEDCSLSSRSCELFSLIIGGEKGIQRASDLKTPKEVLSQTHDSGNREIEMLMNSRRGDEITPVLTCEDLELSLLSNVGDNKPSVITSDCDCSHFFHLDHPKVTSVNDNASRHLLSLLRGEVSPATENMIMKAEQSDDRINNKDDIGKDCISANSLTLETLFGSAFMRELQGSVGSARTEISESLGESASTTGNITANGIGSEMGTIGRDSISVNHISEAERFIPVNNHRGPSVSAMGLSVGSAINTENHFFSNSYEIVGQESMDADTGCTMKTNVFPENFYSSTSSFDFQKQVSHGRLSSGYSLSDLNTNAHMKLTPGNITHYNTIPHGFPSNAFNPYFESPGTESSPDQSCQQAVLQMQMQQMHISRHPRPQLMQGISNNPLLLRGISSSPNLPSQLTRNAALWSGHDPNVMHAFHTGIPQQNLGAFGNLPDFRGGGSGDPEVMKRMAEMQAAQQCMYGLQLDTGFRYR